MKIIYFSIKEVAVLNMQAHDTLIIGNDKITKLKKPSKAQKMKTMIMKVTNDQFGIFKMFEFKLKNVSKFHRRFHMKMFNPEMSFTIELFKKTLLKMKRVAFLKIFPNDLPVDKMCMNDLMMNSNDTEIYMIRMLTHLSEKQARYRSEYVKSPFNQVDIDFLVEHFIHSKESKIIPNNDDGQDLKAPLLTSL